MARQVLFVQGAGEGTHDRWDDKLVASLRRELGPDYDVRYPRMPGEDDPAYPAWKAALTGELASFENGSILVGHSIGGTILLHMIAEQPPDFAIGGLFLIAAPFVGDGGWQSADISGSGDIGERLPPGVPVHLFHGTDDEMVPIGHLHLHAAAIPHAVAHAIKGRDHQLGNDMSDVARAILSLG